MTTKNQLTYSLANLIRGGKPADSDDDNVDHRLLYFWIKNTRAQLIRQDIEKTRSISSNIRQSLGCVDVSLVDASTCCNIKTNCKVFKTDVRIPQPIELYQKDLITRVGPVSLTEQPFQLIPYERATWVGNNPIEALIDIPKAFLFEGFIYIMIKNKNKVISKINIQGVFEDPTEVKTFNTCSGIACYSDDDPFPISANMIETMNKLILETDLKIITSAPSDSVGDGKMELSPNIERK